MFDGTKAVTWLSCLSFSLCSISTVAEHDVYRHRIPSSLIFFSGQFCFLSVAIETKTKLSIDILTQSVFLVLCKSVTADVQVKNGIRTRMCVCSLLSRNISLIYVCPQNTSFKKDFVVFGIWYMWCFWCQIKLHFSFKYVRRLWNYEKMFFPTEFLRFYRPRSFTWKSIHS